MTCSGIEPKQMQTLSNYTTRPCSPIIYGNPEMDYYTLTSTCTDITPFWHSFSLDLTRLRRQCNTATMVNTCSTDKPTTRSTGLARTPTVSTNKKTSVQRLRADTAAANKKK